MSVTKFRPAWTEPFPEAGGPDVRAAALHGVGPPRQRRITGTALAALVCIAAVATGGCGGDSSDGNAANGTPATGAVPETLKIGYNAPLGPLDPNKAGLLQSLMVLNLIGGTLTAYGTDGEPAVAESVAEAPDHLAYTFNLRPDAKFSDGQPVTAQDVKATLDRIRKDKVVGYQLEPVRSISAPDRQKVVVRLSRPFASLRTLLSQSTYMILPRAGLASGESFFEKPISAGQYKLDSVEPDEVRLVANDTYWGPKPRVKTLEFSVVSDAGTRLAQVKSGQLNMAFDMPPNLIPQMTGKVRPIIAGLPGSIELIPNHSAAPVSDVKVRQAINAAVDRDAINKVVFQDKAQPNAGYWPKAFSDYYNPGISTAADPAKAKELLRGTACESGCKLKLLYYTDIAWSQPTALIVQQNLKAIGIDLQLDGKDLATGVAQSQKRQYQLLLGPLTARVADPERLLPSNLDPAIAAGFPTTVMAYKSADMENAIAKFMRAPKDQRVELASTITEQFVRDQPFINLLDFLVISASNVPTDVLNMRLVSLQIG